MHECSPGGLRDGSPAAGVSLLAVVTGVIIGSVILSSMSGWKLGAILLLFQVGRCLLKSGITDVLPERALFWSFSYASERELSLPKVLHLDGRGGWHTQVSWLKYKRAALCQVFSPLLTKIDSEPPFLGADAQASACEALVGVPVVYQSNAFPLNSLNLKWEVKTWVQGQKPGFQPWWGFLYCQNQLPR